MSSEIQEFILDKVMVMYNLYGNICLETDFEFQLCPHHLSS